MKKKKKKKTLHLDNKIIIYVAKNAVSSMYYSLVFFFTLANYTDKKEIKHKKKE